MYSLTDADAQTTHSTEALLSNLMLAAAAKNNITLEIWADCPATAEEVWGMPFDLLGVTVEF